MASAHIKIIVIARPLVLILPYSTLATTVVPVPVVMEVFTNWKLEKVYKNTTSTRQRQ